MTLHKFFRKKIRHYRWHIREFMNECHEHITPSGHVNCFDCPIAGLRTSNYKCGKFKEYKNEHRASDNKST